MNYLKHHFKCEINVPKHISIVNWALKNSPNFSQIKFKYINIKIGYDQKRTSEIKALPGLIVNTAGCDHSDGSTR